MVKAKFLISKNGFDQFQDCWKERKLVIFGMAAMPFPLQFGECFHDNSLAYLFKYLLQKTLKSTPTSIGSYKLQIKYYVINFNSF